MSVMVDLARQARRGINFVLPLLAGGTGRIDGLTRGTVIEVHNSSGATISRGMALKINDVGSAYPVLNVTPTTAGTDRIVGFAVADIPAVATGLMQIVGVCTVLTDGDVAYNDVLYPSAVLGRVSATGSGTAGAARSRQATTGTSQVQADITSELVISGGDLCEPTVVVPGSYHSGAINANDQDTDGWISAIPGGLVGAYALGFDMMQVGQHPLEWFRRYQQSGEATPQDFTSLMSTAATAAWRMQVLGLVSPDADLDATGHWSINHAADGWSIHCALLFTGIAAKITQDGSSGTGTTASVDIITEPGDLVVGVVGVAVASETITDGASQTRRLTGSGGFVDRMMAASTKLADGNSTTMSFSWSTSGQYHMAVVVLRGNVTVGDGHIDVVGTGTKRSRCDHSGHVTRAYAPSVHDDGDWYPPGTSWTDTTTGRAYLLVDGSIDAAIWLETTPKLHASSHQSGGNDAIRLDDLATPDDNTDLNASTARHGLLRKLSGTPTQYMDGTGNWTTPAGGPGGTTQVVRKSADQSFGSTSLADVTDLAFAVNSGTTYYFRFVGFNTMDSAATGMRLAVNGPAGTYRYGVHQMGGGNAPGGTVGAGYAAAVDTAIAFTAGHGAGPALFILEGTVVVGGAGGTLSLRCATETSGSNIYITLGSFGVLSAIP